MKKNKELLILFLITLMCSGPILWVLVAKLWHLSFDKLYRASLLSIFTSLFLGGIWTWYFCQRKIMAYAKELDKLKTKLRKIN